MAVARINIKSIDYFKFKKLVIDGNRDDYNSCSKEVKSLCDCVQTLNFRDEEFDDVADRGRFEEICVLYKQILTSKRIDSLDMRIKSGWWGDHKNAYSAGKIKPAALKELLVNKAKNWISRHGDTLLKEGQVMDKIEGPGLYVFKHREHQCFQYVGMAERIFAQCGEKLKTAFDGSSQEPLAALLIISMHSDWDFYFIPVAPSDGDKVLRVLENDLILKHDCIWPHGLNFRLSISSLLEVSEFRKSCLRHHWPPEGDVNETEIDLNKLRDQISKAPLSPCSEEGVKIPSPASSVKQVDTKPERPKSAKASVGTAAGSTKTKVSPTQAEAPSRSPRPTTPRKLPATPKPTSPTKRPQSAKSSRSTTKEEKPVAMRKVQRTPEPSPTEENGQVLDDVEPEEPAVEEFKPPSKKASKPTTTGIPQSKKPEWSKEGPSSDEQTPPEEPAVTKESPKEEPAASPAEEKPCASSGGSNGASPGDEDDEKPRPLKRTGTYEVLPTGDEEEEGMNGENAGEAPSSSPDEASGGSPDKTPARPQTLERPTSRLPVSKN